MTDVPNYLVRNRRAWDAWAKNYVESGRRGWATDEVTWGIWNVPESDLTAHPCLGRGRSAA